MAKKTKLTSDEIQLENEIEQNQWRFAKLTHKELAALLHESKDSRINLRLSPTVLDYYKRQAERERLPYQTLINQVLEKFAIAHGENEFEQISRRLDKLESLLGKLLKNSN